MDTDVVLQFQHMQMTLRLLSNHRGQTSQSYSLRYTKVWQKKVLTAFGRIQNLSKSIFKIYTKVLTAFGRIQNLSDHRSPLNNCQ